MLKSRRDLKNEAKNALKGNWKSAILLNAIPTLLGIFLSLFTYRSISLWNHHIVISDVNSTAGTSGGILQFIIGFFFSFFFISISFTFLDLIRNSNYKIYPFRDSVQVFDWRNFPTVFKINILYYLFIFLWSLLLIIPGIIKAIAYSQSFYIYKDARDAGVTDQLSPTDYINISRRLMNGHKWRYFVLQLSFIGWHILSILTFGIGYLWLNPYLSATLAAFYNDLAQNQSIELEV